VIFLACNIPTVFGQSNKIERELVLALRGKVLTLKAFRKSSRLEFDKAGQLKNKEENGPWTIYSQFLVTKVEVSESRLRIGGRRIVHHYDKGQSKLLASPSDINVEVQIDVDKSATVADISAVLSKVFAGSEGITPYVPEYWRPYLEGKTGTASCGSTVATVRVGQIQNAQLVKQIRTRYSEEARNFLLDGVVALEAAINESGDVGSLVITKPAGAGLDESAVEAVSQWKYKPTTVDGNPVCVVTTITVNYEFSR